MAAKLTKLTQAIAIQLHLVAECCTICSSLSRRPVRKLLGTPSYVSSQNTMIQAVHQAIWRPTVELIMYVSFKNAKI